LKEHHDVFAWSYKDVKGIPPHIAQHQIELDISIPPTHQAWYRMNPNYTTTIKQDLDKLLIASFITNLHGFLQAKCCNQKRSISFTIAP
jgi:predicted transcriptional regulator